MPRSRPYRRRPSVRRYQPRDARGRYVHGPRPGDRIPTWIPVVFVLALVIAANT
jgi:hypothetical protein